MPPPLPTPVVVMPAPTTNVAAAASAAGSDGNGRVTATPDTTAAAPQAEPPRIETDAGNAAPPGLSPQPRAAAAAAPPATLAVAPSDVRIPSTRASLLPWLLLSALGLALFAWWATMRRSRQLALETERLSRQQRHLKSAHTHLQQKSQQLQQLSMYDPLTGTLNRRAFAAELRERVDHLAKYNQPLALIVFDLDHFKTINDRYGHLLGDAALTLVAGVVREHLVSDDLFGRFGGDEFMIACSGQNVQAAALLAENIRKTVATRAAEAQPPIPGLTLSIGLAQADPDNGYLPDELFARADAALYGAKQGGRNSVMIADAGQPEALAAGSMPRHL